MRPRTSHYPVSVLPLLVFAMAGLAPPAGAVLPWMGEKAVRAELIGAPLEGHYSDGATWRETYFAGGGIDYADANNHWKGKWSFRGVAFCTFYNNERNGGCWQILKISANCYEFYAALRSGKPLLRRPGAKRRWTARGWRKGRASTCELDVGV